MLRALWAVTLDGKERLLYRAPSRLQLEDVAPDGRVLVAGAVLEGQIRFGSFADKTDRSLSWFDWGTSITLSADGKLLGFTESGEGAGPVYGIFVRPTSGEPAVRIADGQADALSPDGKWMAVLDADGKTTRIVPTGAGTTRSFDLSTVGIVTTAAWYPDNRHLAIVAQVPGHGIRTSSLDTTTGATTPVTPEGSAGVYVSPNGELLFVSFGPTHGVLNLKTHESITLKNSTPTDRAAGWSPDSKSVFTFEPGQRLARVYRIDIASGTRTLVATLQPGEPAGLLGVPNVVMAGDGIHFAYAVARQLSQLFVLRIPQ
jgi:WD40 repeat protein